MSNDDKQAKGKGWPENFFEETSGCLTDKPLTIDSEGFIDNLEDLNCDEIFARYQCLEKYLNDN